MTFIPDLQPVKHDSTNWVYPDPDPAPIYVGPGALPPFATLLPIGWLGNRVETRGETPEECIRILLDAYEAGHLFSDGSMGVHTCELCPPISLGSRVSCPVTWNGRQVSLYGHGHYLILHGDSLFICPALILHYILDHQYRPPREFLEAVVKGAILTRADRGLTESDERAGPIR